MSQTPTVLSVRQKDLVLKELQLKFKNSKRWCPCHIRLASMFCCSGLHAWEDVDFRNSQNDFADPYEYWASFSTIFNGKFVPEKVLLRN